AGREVARVGIDAGVVEHHPVPVDDEDPGRDPAPTDRQEEKLDGTIRTRLLEPAPDEDARRRTTGRRGKQAVGAPLALMEVDEVVELRQRLRRAGENDLAARLGPPDLAPDLVAGFLVEGREVVLEADSVRDRDHGADVLAFEVERPAV